MAIEPAPEPIKSVLLPDLDYNTFQHLMEWLTIATLGVIITTAISFFFLYVATENISKSRRSQQAVLKVKKFLPLLKALTNRHNRLSGILATKNAEAFQKVTACERAIHIRNQLEKRKYIQVRFANTPNRSQICFAGYVYNEYVRKYVARGQHYPLLDDDWAVPHLVEVWADSPEAAEQEIFKKYPKAQGYVINNLEPVKPIPTQEQILNNA